MGRGQNHHRWRRKAILVDEETQEVVEDYYDIGPVCYYCTFYFGPQTLGFCRRSDMWVKPHKTCIWFEANRNDW